MKALAADPPRIDGQSWSLRLAGCDGGADWEWRHYDLVHTQARAAIEADPRLNDFARAVLTSIDEGPRIVTDGTIVAGVLPAYARTGDAEEYEVTSWHFAMTPDHLVTSRRRATRTLVTLWDAVRAGLVLAGPGALIDACIADFAREVRGRLANLAKSLDPLEDVLIDKRDVTQLAQFSNRLGSVRREATRAKRALAPLARAVHEDVAELPDWIGLTEQGSGARALHSALDDIAALQDRARSLQDELAVRLTEETNHRLYIVSVVTALVMPATLVTGFFGMNTGGLWLSGDGAPSGTLYAALICAASVGLTLLLLRWKRLL